MKHNTYRGVDFMPDNKIIIRCCPRCGEIDCYNGDVCGYCKSAGYNTKYVDTKYEEDDYWNEHEKELTEAIYQEYVYNSPLYDEDDFNARKKREEQIHEESLFSSRPKEANIPKCPTCGSTNIRKITATEKAAGVVIFGLFSNKRKYQFECQNPKCKYKW